MRKQPRGQPGKANTGPQSWMATTRLHETLDSSEPPPHRAPCFPPVDWVGYSKQKSSNFLWQLSNFLLQLGYNCKQQLVSNNKQKQLGSFIAKQQNTKKDVKRTPLCTIQATCKLSWHPWNCAPWSYRLQVINLENKLQAASQNKNKNKPNKKKLPILKSYIILSVV